VMELTVTGITTAGPERNLSIVICIWISELSFFLNKLLLIQFMLTFKAITIIIVTICFSKRSKQADTRYSINTLKSKM